MTQKELNDVIDLHKKWLNDEEGGVRADLRRANLSGAALRRADLSSADLRRANLSSADLRRANLSGAALRRADLSSADLRSADLSSADLSSADLSSADLRRADLSSADLSSADLRRANLSSAEGTFDPLISLNVDHDKTLHVRVAEAALQPEALNMDKWHTCNTTHCLAGWAVHLSGTAGYALEKLLGPSVAGSILCPELSHLFFEDNERALDACRKVVESNR